MSARWQRTVILTALAFCLIAPADGQAKEKHGANVVVTKTDGLLIEGELIAVRADALLLLEMERDVSLDIEEIRMVTAPKPRIIGRSALTGLVIGGLGGALAGAALAGGDHGGQGSWMLLIGTCGGAAGLVLGLVNGTIADTSKNETFHFSVMNDQEKRAALFKLRKIARFPK